MTLVRRMQNYIQSYNRHKPDSKFHQPQPMQSQEHFINYQESDSMIRVYPPEECSKKVLSINHNGTELQFHWSIAPKQWQSYLPSFAGLQPFVISHPSQTTALTWSDHIYVHNQKEMIHMHLLWISSIILHGISPKLR